MVIVWRNTTSINSKYSTKTLRVNFLTNKFVKDNFSFQHKISCLQHSKYNNSVKKLYTAQLHNKMHC